jgi:serine/threonine protein kinase/WD40 repeat protein
MHPEPASPPTNLFALPEGTELIGEFRIKRVLGAGGFGITYLANETALARDVTIKEYFPLEYAARGVSGDVAPRSSDSVTDYKWGLERFMEEAQTLARFIHPNIVRVYRCFRARDTGYMVLHFEEGGSFKAWLRQLQRAPRQSELDRIVAPLLDALDAVHAGNYLHRDIAPDNIIIRKDGEPVLIDFGSARGEIVAHSKTVSALVKPGYSPYEQYATTTSNQGPWTDIYALGATLYHAISGRRPPDAPSRVVNDEYVPAGEAALSSYRQGFLAAVDRALQLEIGERPQSIAAWRQMLLAPEPRRAGGRLGLRGALERMRTAPPSASASRLGRRVAPAPGPNPMPPDAPQPKGQLLDFIAALKRRAPPLAKPAAQQGEAKPPRRQVAAREANEARSALTYGRPPESPADPPRRARAALGAGTAARANPRARPPSAVPRSPPRPPRRRVWRMPSRPWRVLSYKLLVGLGVAGLAVAYQDGLSHVEGRGSSLVASQSAELGARVRLSGHKGAVTAVATADQGRWIVSCGSDATLRLWNSGSGALVRTLELDDGPATALAVDERRALTGHRNGAIALWDLEHAEKLATFQIDAPVTSVAFATGASVIAATTEAGTVGLFDVGTPSAPATLLEKEGGAPQLMAAARYANLLVTAGGDGMRLWRVDVRGVQRAWRGPAEAASALAIAGSGRLVASGAVNGNVRLYSATSSRQQRLFKAHDGRVTAVAFAPSDRTLATAGEDGLVKLWDLRPGRFPRVFHGKAGPVPAIAFSADGRRIVSAGRDGIIRIWGSEPALAVR